MNCRTFSQIPAREEKATTTTTSFSSVQSLDRLGRRENTCVGRFSRDPLPVFSAGGPCKQFWHRQGHSLFDIVHPAFRLPIEVWYGILKGGFSEAVVARRATVMVTKSLFITIHGSYNNAND